jgi:polysaccharide export outer membrane protein
MALAQSAEAQGLVNRALASREDLEALLAPGQRLSSRERQVIEHRLRDGDFQPGDRVSVSVRGEQALTDTFTVRAGRLLELPDMAPLPLQGVLRSELEPRLAAHVGQYIRTPDVRAQALLRIGILGSVNRPGYYSVRADQPLGDMLTIAGGLAVDGDLSKASVTREGVETWPRKEVRQALASGQSLDVLGFQGGDELQIGRRSGGIAPTLAIVTGLATLATTIILVTRN